MKINNEFTVSAPVEKAWEVMLDLERVAPCLPGAAIRDSDGDEYEGTMKVKIGPITANYKGTVKFEETDEENHRAVLQATGRDARGQGTASAAIVSTMRQEGEQTKVSVETDMKLTGRAAQFGRGIAQDVATRMLDQFAACLEREIGGSPQEATAPSGEGAKSRETPPAMLAGGAEALGNVVSAEPGTTAAAASAPTTSTGRPGTQWIPYRDPQAEAEPFDLGAASQEAILKRAAPMLVALGLLAVVIWLIRR